MNDLDRQLIALLRENARMPVVALAKKLRVARATVQNRIARLEQEGVIVGYTLRLKPEEEVHQIRAIMSLAVESNREEAVMRQLRGHVSVVTLHSVNGRWDLVAELRLDTLQKEDARKITSRNLLFMALGGVSAATVFSLFMGDIKINGDPASIPWLYYVVAVLYNSVLAPLYEEKLCRSLQLRGIQVIAGSLAAILLTSTNSSV